jgi:hypothetical protein
VDWLGQEREVAVKCYESFADKAAQYPGVVREIVEKASAGIPFVPAFPDLLSLHEWARRGRYVPELDDLGNPSRCDIVQAVPKTLRQGGDCDDWAVVILAGAMRAGWSARVVTGGDPQDPARHVWVEIFDGTRWVPLDAKGSQPGRALGDVRQWQKTVQYNVGPQGSGAEVLLNSYADVRSWLTEDQKDLWRNYLRYHYTLHKWKEYGPIKAKDPKGLWDAIDKRLNTKDAAIPVELVLNTLKSAVGQMSPTQVMLIVGKNTAANAEQELFTLRTLEDVNEVQVSEWVAKLQDSGKDGENAVRDFAIAAGAKSSASRKEVAGLMAAKLILEANALGVEFSAWVEAMSRLKGEADAANMELSAWLQGPGASRLDTALRAARPELSGEVVGSGENFFKRVLKTLRKVFVTAPGRVIRDFGKQILKLRKNVPWLSQFVTRPLGIDLMATALEQLGNAMVDGSTRAFDAMALGKEVAGTLVAAGRALAAAGPFLPPPWNVAAVAVGALSMAAGSYLGKALQEAELKKLGIDPYKQTMYVDEFGRQVDADGLPLDPVQRQAELQRRQQQASPQGGWTQGADGYYYGHYDFGAPYGLQYVALIWNGTGWQLGFINVEGQWRQAV